ncbi:MAG TPA: class I adenylate-forming enzyme family protein [Geminicoccaceae bacterium]|nr:class I adenylate-forming enzyme family protein [Geminicoccaceae bacterium]
MAWPDDPLPAIRHELHFGDRLVRCFAERPQSLFGLLEAAVARDPDALALVAGPVRLTYRDLTGQAERLAAGLAARGVGPGDRLALLIGNRPEFLITICAAARLGAIAVPLGTREQAPGLRYMLENCGARLLIYDAELAARLPEDWREDRRVAVGAAPAGQATFATLLDQRGAPPPPYRPGEEDVAIILYTSGTTGRPKGAMLTHLNIVHSVLHYETCMGLGPDDRSLLAVPATHVTGLLAVLLAMVHVGGATVLLPSFKARGFLEVAAAERITHAVMVPAMYDLCLLEPDFRAFDLSAWRIGAYGGAPMPEATIEKLAEVLPRLQLMNAYGATETTSPATLMPFGDTARHPDSVGREVPCAEVRIMDEAGREVAPGAAGEVWIKGPMVVPGYFANDAAAQGAFAAGFWRSGDVGAIDQAGYLRVFDRLKDMINRAGYKVFSAEVENVLAHHPQIVEAAVVARPDPVLGEKVHAFVRARGERLDQEAVRSFCREHLADYKVPEFLTIGTEPLPRNANGKLQKDVLRRRLAEMAP